MQRLPMRCRTNLTGARAGMRRSSARSSATAPASSPRSASSCSASGACTPLRISLPCVGTAALRKPGAAGSELASCTPCPQGTGTGLCTIHSWCFNSAFKCAQQGFQGQKSLHARLPVSAHVRQCMPHSACSLCREIRAHVAEPFWYLHVTYRAPEGQQCAFHWRRGHIFDHAVATVLYEMCVEAPLATITRVRPGHLHRTFR